MVKGDHTKIFSVVLTKRAVAMMALGQGGYLHATGSSCLLWVDRGPRVFDEYSKCIPILFIYIQKGKR